MEIDEFITTITFKRKIFYFTMNLYNILNNKIQNRTNLFVRIILSLAFLGHGLVSLGYSPSYSLHYNLIDVINITNIETKQIVQFQAWFDIVISILLMLVKNIKLILYTVLIYLSFVCMSALVFSFHKTGTIFGFSECLRRFPWIFLSLFLLNDLNGIKKFHFIRIALSCAFIAHGFASLGFLGLNQGHIDLAVRIIPKDNAIFFVYCSGITDSIIGFMLLQSVYTKYISGLAILWISFIVYISYLNAFPDAIFRMGFLLTAIYVWLDEKTYTPKLFKI